MLSVPIDVLDRCIGELDVLQMKVQENVDGLSADQCACGAFTRVGLRDHDDHGSSQS
jgi:hypothetical protein